jgi:hypothetical protein
MTHRQQKTRVVQTECNTRRRWVFLACSFALVCASACAANSDTPSPSESPSSYKWMVPGWYKPYNAKTSIPIGVRYVRIQTLDGPASVSWREIQIMGTQTGDAGKVSNIALNKFTTASHFVNSYTPQSAVDGDPNTSWRAGTPAPATITIDLGKSSAVTSVALLVGQDWPGMTRHVVEVGDHKGDFTLLAAFEEHTSDKRWLTFPKDPQDEGLTSQPVPTPPESLEWTVPEHNPAVLTKGITWIRTHPMVTGGALDAIGSPSQWDVKDYFNHFLANYVHLTADGLPVDLMGWIVADHPLLRWTVSINEDGKGAVNDMILGGMEANAPGRIGYHIGSGVDLSGNLQEQLETLEKGIQTVRGADPAALVILPIHADGDKLVTPLTPNAMSVNVDVIHSESSAFDDEAYALLAQVRTLGLWWKRPYWRSMPAHWDATESVKPTAADLRWNAYVGLLYGFTGHTWSTAQSDTDDGLTPLLFQNKGGLNQNKTSLWTEAASINIGLRNLGTAITQLTSTDVRWVSGTPGDVPDGIEPWAPNAGDDPYLVSVYAVNQATGDPTTVALGFFRDGTDEPYVMAQNQHHPSASAPMNNEDDITLQITFDFTAAPKSLNPAQLITLDHDTGHLAALSLTPQTGDLSALEITLPAGEPILFKYDTNKPFARGP